MTQDEPGAGLRPVPHDLFRSELFPRREGFDVWRDSVLPLFDSDPEPEVPFRARVESYDLQQLFLAHTDFSPMRFQRGRRPGIADGGDHYLIQLYTRGGYAGHNGDRPVYVETGDISLLDLGRPLETRAPASSVLSLVLPRDLIGAMMPGARLRHGSVLRGRTPVARILGSHLLTVWETLPDASLDQIGDINRALIGAVAGAFGGEPAADEPLATADAVTLDAVRVFIHRHLDSDRLSPVFLCRHFGCSRSRLYRLFEPLGGIAGYIRRQRLEHCYQELTRAAVGARVLDIALRWGFDSQSHFSRLFRQAFGISPSEALARGRDRQRQAGRSPRDAMPAAPAFRHWLRRL